MIDWLDQHNPEFPPLDVALDEPDGLLAAGGNLLPPTLIEAYRRGIFPWYSDEDPILWWSPAERAVLWLDDFHVSRSLRKSMRRLAPTITFDQHFEQIILACGDSRAEGTWITDEMRDAYIALHLAGRAHSVDVCVNGELVAGLYGIAMWPYFFGESMFTTVTDGSKMAMHALVQRLRAHGYVLIDCQQTSAHLSLLGATTLPRDKFATMLNKIKIDQDAEMWNDCQAD